MGNYFDMLEEAAARNYLDSFVEAVGVDNYFDMLEEEVAVRSPVAAARSPVVAVRSRLALAARSSPVADNPVAVHGKGLVGPVVGEAGEPATAPDAPLPSAAPPPLAAPPLCASFAPLHPPAAPGEAAADIWRFRPRWELHSRRVLRWREAARGCWSRLPRAGRWRRLALGLVPGTLPVVA